MSNPVYQQLGGQQQPNQEAIGNAFIQFMNANRGQDPNALLQQAVQSGRISQQQLDAAQRMAGQMSGFFNGFKARFGF